MISLFLRNPGRAWVHRNIVMRAGRRGAFLAFLAILDLLYGWSLYTAPAAQRKSFDLLLPWQAWGVIWAAVGVAMITGILVRRDVPQFTAAILLKTAWGVTYLNLWLSHGIARTWVAAVIWLTFAGVVVVISGWREPGYPEIIMPKLPDLPDLPEIRKERRR